MMYNNTSKMIHAADESDGTTPSLSSCYISFNLVVVGCNVPRNDQGSLVVIFNGCCAKLLYIQNLNSTVSLLSYFDCHVLWDKFTTNTYPALIHLY